MIVYAMDIETTGLEPERDQILQVALIEYDTEEDQNKDINKLRSFNMFVKHDRITGSAFALAMNAWILKGIADKTLYPVIKASELVNALANWFQISQYQLEKRTFIGKNVNGFDYQFLKRLDRFNEVVRPNYRFLDIGSMFFGQHSSSVPSLKDCAAFANYTYREHDALEDCRAVIACLRYALKRNWR